MLRLASLAFDATDPARLARFWAAALGWSVDDRPTDVIGVRPTDGTGFLLEFAEVPQPKTSKNPIHLDLVSESVGHQREVVDRLIGLGGRHVDIGQDPEDDD